MLTKVIKITEYSPSWASEKVKVWDTYVLLDLDGNGILSRWHVMYCGDHILEKERFDHVPYAIGSSIGLPFRIIGRSLAEVTCPTAYIRTALARGMQDNLWMSTNPRLGISKNVNKDDAFECSSRGCG